MMYHNSTDMLTDELIIPDKLDSSMANIHNGNKYTPPLDYQKSHKLPNSPQLTEDEVWLSPNLRTLELVRRRKLIRRYSFNEQVIHAGLIQFNQGGCNLVIILQDSAQIYNLSTGDQSSVSFPFPISAAFNYSGGIILERKQQPLPTNEDYEYKYITLTDPISPFGLVSFANNQIDILRNSRMVSFANSSYGNNFSVLYDSSTNMLHIYYTRLLENNVNRGRSNLVDAPQGRTKSNNYFATDSQVNETTGQDPLPKTANRALRRIFSSKRRVSSITSGTNSSVAVTTMPNANISANLNLAPGNDQFLAPHSILPTRDISSAMNRIYSSNNRDRNPNEDISYESISQSSKTTALLSSHPLDDNAVLSNNKQEDSLFQTILSKDLSLVKVSSIALPEYIRFDSDERFRALCSIPLNFEDSEAIVLFDSENNFSKIWSIKMTPAIINSVSFKLYGNSPDGLISLSNFNSILTHDSETSSPRNLKHITTLRLSSQTVQIPGSLALFYEDDKDAIVLYNPLLDIFSTPLKLKTCMSDAEGRSAVLIKDSFKDSLDQRLQNTKLIPSTDLTKHCFELLKEIVPSEVFYPILFSWQHILNQEISMGYNMVQEFQALSLLLTTLLHFFNTGNSPDLNSPLYHDISFNYLTKPDINMVLILPKIVMGFHLLREEIYLNVLRSMELGLMDEFLKHTVKSMNWPVEWVVYYSSDTNATMENIVNDDNTESRIFAHPLDEPPSIMKSLYSITENSQIPLTPFISFSRLVDSSPDVDVRISPRCFKTIRLYEMIRSPDFTSNYLLDILSGLKISINEINTYPVGIMKPIKDILHIVENTVSKPDPALNLSLINRPDLRKGVATLLKDNGTAGPVNVLNEEIDFSTPTYISLATENRKPRSILSVLTDVTQMSEGEERNKPSTLDSMLDDPNWSLSNATNKNNELKMKENSDLIFATDQRFKEAITMVNNSVPQRIHFLCTSTEYTKILTKRKIYLKIIALRMATSGIGNGSIMYGTETPLSTQIWNIPIISDTVVFPNGSRLKITTDEVVDTVQEWTSFHSGVSSGLKISPNSSEITGSWISYNRPQKLDAMFGGFLLGLGLNGHLKNLEEWHIYNYLSPKITFVSVGLLLGLCASNRKSKDYKLIKVLSVHIVALLPEGSNDLNINVNVQIAGLVGLGLILQGSQNSRISMTLLKELKSLIKIQDEYRSIETYRIGVGIGIGLINLGYGNSLDHYKQSRDEMSELIEEGLGMQTGHDNYNEKLPENQYEEDKLVSELLSIIDENPEKEKDWISENSQIGSIICLAFLFLRTNNSKIASSMSIHHVNEYITIRADLYMYREWMYYMIMWDTIDYSLDFLLKDINPSRLKTNIDSGNLPIYYTIAGRVLAIGIKFASSNKIKVRNNLLTLIDTFLPFYQYTKGENEQFGTSADFKLTIKGINILLNTLIVSSSMVMCASGDIEVLRRVRYLHDVVTGRFSDMYKHMPRTSSGNTNADDTAMSTADISGQVDGDLNQQAPANEFENELDNEDMEAMGEEGVEEHMKKRIREEIENENHYGKYMSTNMALGFLFLGSGQYALKTSTLEDIAYIILSVIPLYMEPYPFQELKHFWSLSVEPRCLVIKDSITNKAINGVTVNVTFETSSNLPENPSYEMQTLTTPCLLPDIAKIVQIKTNTDKYYPLELNFDAEKKAVDYFKEGTIVYILPKSEEENVYRSVKDIQTALCEKMERFNGLAEKSQPHMNYVGDKSCHDPVMMELKSELSKMKTSSYTLSSDYNVEMLCSDVYSGDVADYNIEAWKAKHLNGGNV